MNKFLLTLGLAAVGSMAAQADIVRMSTPADYQVFAISPNGLWAVGMQGDGTGDMYCFRWNLLTNDIEVSNKPSYCGTSISNDGVYCGGYTVADEIGRKTTYAGYYDGTWHALPVPAEYTVLDAIDGSITPDGRYMAVTLELAQTGGQLNGGVWKDGEWQYLLNPAEGGVHSRVYCISDNGRYTGGWSDTGNRQTVYWDNGGQGITIDNHKSPFAEAIRFSEDNTKMLWYGGWDSYEYIPDSIPSIYGLYDLNTGDITKFKALDDAGSAFNTHGLLSDNTVYGEYNSEPVLIREGQTLVFRNWLKENYQLDIDTLPELQTLNDDGTPGGVVISRLQSMSRDGKTFCLFHYGNDNILRSTIVRLEASFDDASPVALAAKQIKGMNAAQITWKAPYGMDASTILGYNIYRDGQKLNAQTLTATEYFDGGLSVGSHAYEVAMLTDKGESSRTPIDVEIAERTTEGPNSVFARQMGYSSALLTWNAPETNLNEKRYYSTGTATEGFGATQLDLTMETAIAFPRAEMDLYAGQKIQAVTFYPMSVQRNMAVTLYSRDEAGALTVVATKKINNRELVLGQKNTVTFDTPIAIPATGDLLVATQAEIVDDATSTNVFGMEWGSAQPGRSDLLRRVSAANPEDFASMLDMGAQVGIAMNLSWKISLIIAPEGSAADIDTVDHYTVDGNRADTLRYETVALPEGSNTLEVKAVYADGRVSAPAIATVDIAPRTASAPAIDAATINVDLADGNYTASWQQPLDFDATPLAYHHNQPSNLAISAPAENNYNLVAGVKFPAALLRGYEGYLLKSVRFMAGCDATFTVLVNKGSEQIVEQEVDDYEVAKWTTVALDEPVVIEPNTDYTVYIDCYDVEPEGAPLFVERGYNVAGLSDMINYGGNIWDTLEGATAIAASWLIDAQMEAPEGREYPSPAYNLYIGSALQNTLPLAETTFTAPVELPGEQAVEVGVTYPGATEKMSGKRTFDFGASGVENVAADGQETPAALYNLQGILLNASATADDLRTLPAGTYILGNRKVQVK